jgi:hypothetical protein
MSMQAVAAGRLAARQDCLLLAFVLQNGRRCDDGAPLPNTSMMVGSWQQLNGVIDPVSIDRLG